MSKSLEALKDLYHGNLTKEYKLQCYKDIEKDLELLEIILKVINIEKEDLYYDDEIGYMFLGGKISKQEYEKIKEWLKK